MSDQPNPDQPNPKPSANKAEDATQAKGAKETAAMPKANPIMEALEFEFVEVTRIPRIRVNGNSLSCS